MARTREMTSVALNQDVLPRTEQDLSTTRLSSFVKGGAMLLLTACVDLGAAFVAPYWATWSSSATKQHGGYGLWKTWQCPDVGQGMESLTHDSVECQQHWADYTFPAWYMATQVCVSLSLLGMLSAFILLLIYVFLAQCSRNKVIMDAVIGTCYSAGFLLLVGLCLFGSYVVDGIAQSKSEWFLSWSFTLSCTAFVLNAIAASILVTESKRLQSTKERAQPGQFAYQLLNKPRGGHLTRNVQHVWQPVSLKSGQ